jgi:3',5'-cyclic-AMP phosphodiesterase
MDQREVRETFMRILDLEPQPFHELAYWGAAVTGGPEERHLPILRAKVDGLPEQLDAILAAADLQGLEKPKAGNREPRERLLGEALADEILALSAAGAIPRADRIGVLLGGDLACRPAAERRGGYRDVMPVWNAFNRFRWLAGVAGNHDIMGRSPRELRSFKKGTAIYFLDANVATADGLRVAGLGGVIGNPRKPYRRNESDFLNALRSLLSEKPDILILHESPEVPGRPGTGDPRIGEALREARDLLVICGHRRWEEPLAELEWGIQLMNVDERVILLMRPGV